MLRSLVVFPLLIVGGLNAIAEEGGLHQVRLSVDSLPTTDRVTTTFSSGGASVAQDSSFSLNDAGRLKLGYCYASNRSGEFAFSIGAGLAHGQLHYKKDPVEVTIREPGLFLEPGLVYRPLAWLAFEGSLYAGGGAVKTDAEVGGVHQHVDDTAYGEYGVTLRGLVIGKAGWQIFVEGGYLAQTFTYKTTTDVLGAQVDTQAKNTLSGGFIGAGIGWGF